MKSIHLRILSKMGLDQAENFNPKITEEKVKTQPESNKAKSFGLGLQILQIKTQPKEIFLNPRVTSTRTKTVAIPRLPKIEPKVEEEKKIIALPVINKTPKPKPKKSRTLQDITPTVFTTKQIDNQENQSELRSFWQLHQTPHGKSKDVHDRNEDIPETSDDYFDKPITIVQSKIRSSVETTTSNQGFPMRSLNDLTLRGSVISSQTQTFFDNPFSKKSGVGSRTHRDLAIKVRQNSKDMKHSISNLKSLGPLSRKQSMENLIPPIRVDKRENIDDYRFDSSREDHNESLEEYLVNKRSELTEHFEFDYTAFTKPNYNPNPNIKVLKLD
jgi:hypothetical protein